MLEQLCDTVANGGLGLIPNQQVAVMMDGRPMPSMGRYFVSIHDGDRTNNWLMSDKSYYTLNVTISALAQQPFDRLGPDLIDMQNGLDDYGDSIWQCIFSNQWDAQYISGHIGIMARANAQLAGWPNNYQWVEALYPQNIGPATPRPESWFLASSQRVQSKAGANKSAPYAGLSLTIRFAGAVRITNQADDPG